MVAHLVALKLALLRNGLRRSPWQVVGLAFGAAYGVFLAGLATAALIAVATQDLALRSTVTTVFGGLLVLGWWLVPLLAFGIDATLDPRRFVTFPVPRRSLLAGLTVAGLVGIPGALTVVVSLVAVVVWWREPVAALAQLVVGAVAVLTAVIGSRATTSLAAAVFGRRRFRDLAAVVAVVPLLLMGPALTLLGDGVRLDGNQIERFAGGFGWMPFAAGWTVPGLLAAGRWASAAAHLTVALATLAALVWVWDRAMAHALVEPASDTRSRGARGLGWFGRLPGTPTGAVAARCLTYWVRDPRYATGLLVLPLLLVVFAVVDPTRHLVLAVGPMTGALLGWTVSADIAYDGTAFWFHLAAPGASGADRRGRALAVLAVAVPLSTVLTVVSAAIAGRPELLPALLGAAFGLLLASLGCASVGSALVVWRVRQAGENPFAVSQGASIAAMASQMLGFTAVGVLAAPTLVLAVLAVVRDSVPLGWLTLAVGPLLGLGYLAAGVRIGARELDRRGPELFAQLMSF